MNTRFGEVQAELKKYPYKFGILVIVISESSQFAAMQEKIKSLAAQDETGRMAIYLLKYFFTDIKYICLSGIRNLQAHIPISHGIKTEFSTEAKNAYQHFMAKREYIADDYHMHVFKAAMLLIAVIVPDFCLHGLGEVTVFLEKLISGILLDKYFFTDIKYICACVQSGHAVDCGHVLWNCQQSLQSSYTAEGICYQKHFV